MDEFTLSREMTDYYFSDVQHCGANFTRSSEYLWVSECEHMGVTLRIVRHPFFDKQDYRYTDGWPYIYSTHVCLGDKVFSHNVFLNERDAECFGGWLTRYGEELINNCYPVIGTYTEGKFIKLDGTEFNSIQHFGRLRDHILTEKPTNKE